VIIWLQSRQLLGLLINMAYLLQGEVQQINTLDSEILSQVKQLRQWILALKFAILLLVRL
jgi:hypothetical protein